MPARSRCGNRLARRHSRPAGPCKPVAAVGRKRDCHRSGFAPGARARGGWLGGTMPAGAFLNRYEPQQVPHLAPDGFARSCLRRDWHMRIQGSTRSEIAFSVGIGARSLGHWAVIERACLSLWPDAIDPIARHISAPRKCTVRRPIVYIFAGFDMLVAPKPRDFDLRRDPWLGHASSARHPRVLSLAMSPGPAGRASRRSCGSTPRARRRCSRPPG